MKLCRAKGLWAQGGPYPVPQHVCQAARRGVRSLGWAPRRTGAALRCSAGRSALRAAPMSWGHRALSSPPPPPTDEELQDWALYAENVRQLMGRRLGVPLVDQVSRPPGLHPASACGYTKPGPNVPPCCRAQQPWGFCPLPCRGWRRSGSCGAPACASACWATGWLCRGSARRQTERHPGWHEMQSLGRSREPDHGGSEPQWG